MEASLSFFWWFTALLFEHTSIGFRCCLAANVAFWLASAVNLIVDHHHQAAANAGTATCVPAVEKLQANVHLTRAQQGEIAALAALNMLVVAPLLCGRLFDDLLWPCLVETVHGTTTRRLTDHDAMDWRTEFLVKVPLHMVVTEVAFYTAHYVMHKVPFIYRHVHAVHHRVHAPTAMAAAYAHPVEFVVGNALPIALGPMLTNAHPVTCYLWFAAAMLSTCKGHCGYDVLNAATHDVHHARVGGSGNYGVLHFMDTLCGTTIPVHTTKRAVTEKVQ